MQQRTGVPHAFAIRRFASTICLHCDTYSFGTSYTAHSLLGLPGSFAWTSVCWLPLTFSSATRRLTLEVCGGSVCRLAVRTGVDADHGMDA